MTILLLAALLPPLFLMIKIYKLDKVEREPGSLIVKLLIFGVLTTIPAAFLEGFLISLVGGVISPKTPCSSWWRISSAWDWWKKG